MSGECYRRLLGNTGISISPIGLGCWRLGKSAVWGEVSDEEAIAMVHAALDQKCSLLDTSPNYGETNSERLLGEALIGRRQEAVIVSKTGHVSGGGENWDPDYLWRSLNGTLERLKTDYLDVCLLHNPPIEVLDVEHAAWKVLLRAQSEGMARHIGASLDTHESIARCMERANPAVLEILFNIFHQNPRRLFDDALKNGVGLIAKVPLDSGWLTGKYTAKSSFTGVRARWNKAMKYQREQLLESIEWLSACGDSLRDQALRYCQSYDAVSCVIPGARSVAQVMENCAIVGQSLEEGERRKLEKLWDEVTEDGKHPLPW